MPLNPGTTLGSYAVTAKIGESFVRKALTRILPDASLSRVFSGAEREDFLDNLVFQE